MQNKEWFLYKQYEVWEYNSKTGVFGLPHGTYRSMQDAKNYISKIKESAVTDYHQIYGFDLVIIKQERKLIEL